MLVVGAALVDDLVRPTRLLAARRTGPPELAGGWELPGGKIHPREAPTDALRRELREELSVGVELGAELLRRDADGAHPDAPRRDTSETGWTGAWPLPALAGADLPRGLLRVWRARVSQGEVTLGADHDAYRWLERGEWFDVAWLDVDRPVVARLQAETGGTSRPRGS